MISGQGHGDIVLKRMLIGISLLILVTTLIIMGFTNGINFDNYERLHSSVSAFGTNIRFSLVMLASLFSMTGIYRGNRREISLGIIFALVAFSHFYMESLPEFIDQVSPVKTVIVTKTNPNFTINSSADIPSVNGSVISEGSNITVIGIRSTESTVILEENGSTEEGIPINYIVLQTVLGIFLATIITLFMVYVARLNYFLHKETTEISEPAQQKMQTAVEGDSDREADNVVHQ
jgi:hypothetical protein